MHFMRLPQQMLINVLLNLDIEDVLRCEQFCAPLRDAVASKSLWLGNLRRLDRHSPPDLPPQIKPESLTLEELRKLVVSAKRIRKHLLAGEVSYDLRQTVPIEDPFEGKGNLAHRDQWNDTIRLSPGGRFLFVLWEHNVTEGEDEEAWQAGVVDEDEFIPPPPPPDTQCERDGVLQIYDLHNDHRCICIWTYAGIHKNNTSFKILTFDFEMYGADGFRVAIGGRDQEASSKPYVLQMFDVSRPSGEAETSVKEACEGFFDFYLTERIGER